jgi:hypothetical protein
MKISVPDHINATGLLPFLTLISQPIDSEEIVVDFTRLRRVTPAGLVALSATVIRWLKAHHRVSFQGLDGCPIADYLRRMDLLKVCGFDSSEGFTRHDSKGRFVPVKLVDEHVPKMGDEIATCLAPGGDDFGHPMGDLYDLVFYVMTEIANNIRQHSLGLGYASAQVTRSEGLVRVALADNGIGILESFRNAGHSWSQAMNHPQGILKALEPRVSCKGGEPNEGVGLTLVSALARLTKSWLMILSGSGVVQILPNVAETKAFELPDGGIFPGTIIALTCRQDAANGFSELLYTAKDQAGLLRRGTIKARFEP